MHSLKQGDTLDIADVDDEDDEDDDDDDEDEDDDVVRSILHISSAILPQAGYLFPSNTPP